MDDEPELFAPPLRPPLANTSAPRDREPDAADFEHIRKWQEQRIERKLRGEYESAVLRLGELISSNLETPMRIAAVRVEGATHTRPSFIDWLIKPHLAASHAQAQQQQREQQQQPTLADVLRTARGMTHTLLETDIFAAVNPTIAASRDALADPGDVDIVLQTRQKGRFFLKTSTELGDQEGSVSIQGRARNAFGGAETLEANFSSGLKTRLAGNVSLSAPLTPALTTRGELSLFGLERDLTGVASCMEGVRGVRGVIRTASRSTFSEFAYEAALRHIRGLAPTASVSIREAAGHSVKSALSHTWQYDTRDDKAVPTCGVYARSYQELAGLGGDAAFLKSSLNLHLVRRLFPGSTLTLSGRAGLLYPLRGREPHFNDRFQLGGPLDVRLFRQNGLGPRDGADALGGDVFWATGLSVISDLPRKPQWPVKTHLFVNAGCLDRLNKGQPLAQNVAACVLRPSISAGVGLLYRMDPVRVEINFGVPLAANESDGHRRGFQLGIGLDFL